MSRLSLFACLACLAASVGLASADMLTYAVTDTGRFGTLDLDTGDFAPVGDVAFDGYNGIGNLDDGTLVGVDGGNNFVEIDATSGAITIIGPTGIGVFGCGSLLTGEQYAVDRGNRLYQIDPSSGAATLVGATGLPRIDLSTFANAFAGDDAYNLYYIFEQGGRNPIPSTLFQLDPTTGAATAIGPTGLTGIAGAGFVNGTLYAYRTGTSTDSHAIYTIDLCSGTATDTGVRYSSSITIVGSNPGGAP
jgi:hypothetical protein